MFGSVHAPSILAVIAATIASQVVGALWYSPLLFGRVWVRVTFGSKAKLPEKAPLGPFIVSFVTSVAIAVCYAMVLSHCQTQYFDDVVKYSTFAAVFIAIVEAQHYSWSNRSWWGFGIEQLHNFALFVVQGCVLVMMGGVTKV